MHRSQNLPATGALSGVTGKPSAKVTAATRIPTKAIEPSSRPAAEVRAAPDAAKLAGRYLVQLSSVKSRARANREWVRLKKFFPKELEDLALIVEERKIASRGTFFRVQTGGFRKIGEARALCRALKAKKQDCLPIRR